MNSYNNNEQMYSNIQLFATSTIAQNLYDQIDASNSKYNPVKDVDVTDKISLEKLSYQKPTNEEIQSQSETDLYTYMQESLLAIESEYSLKADELTSQKDQYYQNKEVLTEEFNQEYEIAVDKVTAQALDNGLSRSSVLFNQVADLTKTNAEKILSLSAEIQDKITALDFEITALITQKNIAVNSFNVSYAVKLQEKIDELTKEAESKEQEIIDYNNTIALKEIEFNKGVDELKSELEQANWDNTTELLEIYGKYGSNLVTKVMQDEALAIAQLYFSALSTSEINQVLYEQGLMDRLGDNYKTLLAEYS